MDAKLESFIAIDAELCRLAQHIHLLKALEWPAETEASFLAGWRAGNAKPPIVDASRPDLSAQRESLATLRKRCDTSHPLGRWLAKNIWSYDVAARMLMSLGRREFTDGAIQLYGRPDENPAGQGVTNLDLAERLLKALDGLRGNVLVPDPAQDIPAEAFAERMRVRIRDFFAPVVVEVRLNPKLPARAAAAADRVDVRSDALFSELDLEQLAQHEAFVHAATAINGRAQPTFKSLGLGAPRTTRDQEGLASFAEIITQAIDLNRLRRLALRVHAVQQALDGADFVQVFRGFLDHGQSESESYKSAERVFRGGDPAGGGICFTKDGAYLEGIVRVYAYLRKALSDDRPEAIRALFVGRLTLADAVELAPFIADGTIAAAQFISPWAADLRRLMASMAFFTMTAGIAVDAAAWEHFVGQEQAELDAAGY